MMTLALLTPRWFQVRCPKCNRRQCDMKATPGSRARGTCFRCSLKYEVILGEGIAV